MPIPFSPDYTRETQASASNNYPVTLLQIDNAALLEPIRLVNDTRDIRSNDNDYIACAFNFANPNDSDKESPRAKIVVDNIGREFVRLFEQTHGARGSKATISVILRSNPDFIERTVIFDLNNIVITAMSLTAELGFDTLLDIPAIQPTYRPKTHPSLY